MAKIEIGRYSELLRRALGMKGVTEVSGELSPEISPTWQLERDDPEWQFLKAVRLQGSALSLTGVAVELNRFHLVNPTGSGVIATVSPIHITAEQTSTWVIRLVGTPLATLGVVGTAVPRDTRWDLPAAGASPLIFSGEDLPGGIGSGFLVYIGRFLANTPFLFSVPIVLAPGSSIQWGATTPNNVSVATSVAWKERQLPSLEE